MNNYFWRTYDQQEINWVEEWGGKLYGYGFKWSTTRQPNPPKGWTGSYPEAKFTVINPNNHADWVRE